MMPGSAIGSTSSIENASLPKKRWRHIASAASVPSSSASSVAAAATCSDSPTASRMSGRRAAAANHCSVKPCSGKLNAALSVLKAYSAMTSSGRCNSPSPHQASSFNNGEA